MYLVRTPKIAKRLFPSYLWSIPELNNTLYLTFDDGPVPDATPWVLDTLDHFDAKASFFCIGQNVEKHPDIYQDIKSAGHTIGNHSHTHISGWQTPTDTFLSDIDKASQFIESKLFRPPYGKIKPSQAKKLMKQGYQIVMWDILSGDFDQYLDGEKCYQNVYYNVNPGSIIVFHDSTKAIDTLKNSLPKLLEQLSQDGYEFKAL